MSLFGRVRKFFRADAAPVAPPAQPATRRDSSRGGFGAAGGYSNPITGLGMPGTDSRSASQYHAGYMTDELAVEMWRGDKIAQNIVSMLPEEALEPGVTLTIQDEKQTASGQVDTRPAGDLVEDVERCHRDLKTDAIITRANEWERLFGGSAIWAGANDYQAGNWAEPLNLEAKALSIRWLDVVRSRDLTPVRRYMDPAHPKFGQVEVWHLSRTIGGGTMTQQADIHESRLFLFRGRRIVEDGTVITQNLQSTEFGDGILLAVQGALRRFQEALDNTELAMRANGELLWQHNRLSEILANEGEDDFRKLVSAMNFASSILRARVVGADQTLTRQSISLAGLADIVTKFENELCALAGTPRTKLFGEVPGGLGNNAAGPHGDWDETKGVYRKHSQLPAYEWVTKLIFRSLGGEPRRWKLEGKPYRHPTEQEQGAIVKGEADTDIALSGAGIVTAEEVRARPIWRERYALPDPAAEQLADPGAIPDDIRDPAAGTDPAAAPAEEPKLAEVALNGAQALAISAIAEKVAAGILPRESAVAQLMYSFKAPREAAEQMVPQAGFRPRAVESGLEAPPAEGSPAATPPRTDAADRTMVALLKKLAPSGKCDDCGKRLPLEVDHVDGRGWDPAALSKQQRAAKYWQEHDDGRKLRALCRSCNGRDGAKNKQGKSGPRHRSDAIDTGATLRFTYAPLPPEIVETMEALQAEVMPAGGLAQEIDHVTLVYCPKAAADIPEEKVAEVVAALRAAAAGTAPIAAKVQGWAYFDGARKDGEDRTALVALIDAPGITQLQVRLQDALVVAGMEPSSAHSFAPHFTLCYLAPGERVDELPAIAAEFTIDRICFANREVHEIQLGGGAAPGQSRDPVATVEAITPFQLRALAGEPRDSLVATLELALGVPAAMAERLIPQHPGPSGIDPDDDDDDDLDDLDDLDDDDDDDDDDDEDETRGDADDPDPVDPEEIEERDDCDNPIRGEGGLFDGCAPGEGGGAGSSTKASPSAKAAGEKPAAPAKKLTPKQKAAAKAKAVREKAKAKIAKEKAKLKAKKEKERAKVKAAKDKARAKIKAAKEKAKAKIAAQKQKLQAKKAAAAVKKAEAAKAKMEKSKAKAEAAKKKLESAKAKSGKPLASIAEVELPKAPPLTDHTGAPLDQDAKNAYKQKALGDIAGSKREWESHVKDLDGPIQETPVNDGFTLAHHEFEGIRRDFDSKLSQKEREAALYYSSYGDRVLNHAMRSGEIDNSENADVREFAKDLDAAISKHTMEEDTQVSRVVVGPWVQDLVKRLKPGAVFRDKGYTSTSATKALQFDEAPARTAVMSIKIPKGAKAAPLPTRYPTETEFLLPRGSRFRVSSIKKAKNGQHNIELEMIP